MPPVTDTRERLITAASELFWERGYAATGLSDILQAAGARGGSLYHFFPNKDDLLLAVIDAHVRVFESAIENAIAVQQDPVAKVLAVGEFYRRFMQRTGCTLGCPLMNLSGEIRDSHPQAGERIAAFLATLTARIAQSLRELHLPGPESLAQAVLSMIHGSVMHSRATGDIAPLDACMEHLSRLLVLNRPQIVVRPSALAASPSHK